jgi:lactate dehydrogenase-like 2-hydroxyacid dehydrogenase
MDKYKIYITDYPEMFFDIAGNELEKVANIELLNVTTELELFPKIVNADAIIVDKVKISEYTISKFKNCKIIVRLGVGFDNVDLIAAGKKGIRVCNIPDFGTDEVADHTWALILSVMRKISMYNEELMKNNNGWNPMLGKPIYRLAGKTIGIIGLGRIGTATAIRAKSFGLHVLFYDPYVPKEQKRVFDFRRVELEELLKKSDIITFHIPLTEETGGFADDDFFKKVKKNVFIFNTARGGIIRLDALYNAMKNDVVAGAGLDVLEIEPPDEKHPLIRAWRAGETWIKNRLIITPHVAFYSQEATKEMRQKAASEILKVFDGEEPKNCVNKQFLVKPCEEDLEHKDVLKIVEGNL